MESVHKSKKIKCCENPQFAISLVSDSSSSLKEVLRDIVKMGATQSCGFGVLNKSTIPEINIGLSMQATHYYENGVKENEIFYRWPGAVWYTVYAYARDPSGKNDITNGQVAKEVVLSTVFGGIGAIGATIAAGITVATMGAALAPAAFAGLAAEAGGIAAASGAGLVAEAVASGATVLLAEASVASAVASGAGALSSTFGTYRTAEAASRALGLAFENSKLYCECKGNYGGGSGSWLVVEGGPYMDKHGNFQPRDLSIRKATQEEIENGVFTEISHERFHTCEGLQCTRRCPYCKK